MGQTESTKSNAMYKHSRFGFRGNRKWHVFDSRYACDCKNRVISGNFYFALLTYLEEHRLHSPTMPPWDYIAIIWTLSGNVDVGMCAKIRSGSFVCRWITAWIHLTRAPCNTALVSCSLTCGFALNDFLGPLWSVQIWLKISYLESLIITSWCFVKQLCVTTWGW